MTPFKRGHKVTQLFGVRPEYYSQFGFKGHEGLDLIPTDEQGNTLPLEAGKDNWDVLAVEDGVVVRDVDDPKSGAYGTHVVVLNNQTKRAWWYCHLQRNDVTIGQQIKRGGRLGLMGATGNTQGAHLHLNLRLADDNGNPINLDNGYKGFVDPKQALESFNTNSPFPPVVDYKKLYEGEVEAHKKDNTEKDETIRNLKAKLGQAELEARETIMSLKEAGVHSDRVATILST